MIYLLFIRWQIYFLALYFIIFFIFPSYPLSFIFEDKISVNRCPSRFGFEFDFNSDSNLENIFMCFNSFIYFTRHNDFLFAQMF
jgi:hypothetical protein